MLTFEEARSRVLDGAPRLGSETVPLDDAAGRVLAEAATAASALPAFDYSAMDGYAVSTDSFEGEGPWDLPLSGESRTGRPAPRLEPGTASRIFTGAAIPEGGNAVVMQEVVERRGESVRFATRPAPGDHLRRAGEDLAEGAVALEAGTRLGAYQLGLVAAADRGEVRVVRRPRVTIVSTGDELRRPGSPARAASIPESNGIVVAALARAAGATVRVAAPSSDDAEDTTERLAAALADCDVLVTIGGVSVGDHDVVRPALEAAGVKLEFHKVAIKPGKPLTLGRRGDTVVMGLPGNPVSAQVTFALFGLPLLRRMQGETRVTPEPRRLILDAPIRQKTGRRGFYAARVEGDHATPLSAQSSGSTTSLAHADALIVVPEDSVGFAAGDSVDAFLLGEL